MYVCEQKRLDEETRHYKEEIEKNIEKRIAEINKLKEEIKVIELKNE